LNYLAHAFLSFGHPEITVGNLISDFVKGKKRYDYPLLIQHGIGLHRLIDRFTDDHPVTQQAKEFFRADYRLYSAVFIDIVYDHFLANDQSLFSEYSLFDFSQSVYENLDKFRNWLPAGFAGIFPYMKSYNWLYNYSSHEGIKKSFQGMVYRAAYLSESDTAYMLFEKHYSELESCYIEFFPQVNAFARKHFEDVVKPPL
jgi:acyl carrier protein phosphodiesterase